jgi:hypothetical protein
MQPGLAALITLGKSVEGRAVRLGGKSIKSDLGEGRWDLGMRSQAYLTGKETT